MVAIGKPLGSTNATWSAAGVITTGAWQDIEVVVSDANGAPQPGATIKVWLDVDDLTRVYRAQAASDASGRARFVIPAAALARGRGDRWVHVTAGATYPLAETALPVGT